MINELLDIWTTVYTGGCENQLFNLFIYREAYVV